MAFPSRFVLNAAQLDLMGLVAEGGSVRLCSGLLQGSSTIVATTLVLRCGSVPSNRRLVFWDDSGHFFGCHRLHIALSLLAASSPLKAGSLSTLPASNTQNYRDFLQVAQESFRFILPALVRPCLCSFDRHLPSLPSSMSHPQVGITSEGTLLPPYVERRLPSRCIFATRLPSLELD